MKKIIYYIIIGLMTFNCSEVVLVEDISDEQVIVLAPTNNAVLNQSTITFTWESVEDAEDYNIQIAQPTFSEALQILTDSTFNGLNFTKTLNVGNYEWRVRGLNTEYQTQYSTQKFTIE